MIVPLLLLACSEKDILTATTPSTDTAGAATPGTEFSAVVAPDRLLAYVPNADSMDLSVLDLETREEVARVPLGLNPKCVALSPDRTRLVVSNNGLWGVGSNILHVLDTRTFEVLDIVEVLEGPEGVAFTPDGRFLYVANPGPHDQGVPEEPGHVLKLDAETWEILADLEVGDHPWGVAVDGRGTKVYVTNAHSETLSVIGVEEDQVLDTVELGDGYETGVDHHPVDMSFDLESRYLYVTHMHASMISKIDTWSGNTIVDRLDVSEGACPSDICMHPHAQALSPDGRFLYVALFGSFEVAEIDLETFTMSRKVAVDEGPKGLDITPDGTTLVVTRQFANSANVALVDTATFTIDRYLQAGEGPEPLGDFIVDWRQDDAAPVGTGP